MKKAAWTIYGLLIVSFNLFALILAVNTSDGLAGVILSSFFAAFYLTGLYGYCSGQLQPDTFFREFS